MKLQNFNHILIQAFNANDTVKSYSYSYKAPEFTYTYPVKFIINGTSVLYFHPRKSIKESTLETEGPLSEKDEVKKAEQRTMDQQKKVDKQHPKKDKK